jgi:hypothetical protein
MVNVAAQLGAGSEGFIQSLPGSHTWSTRLFAPCHRGGSASCHRARYPFADSWVCDDVQRHLQATPAANPGTRT